MTQTARTKPASTEELDAIVAGTHVDPHQVLGPHEHDGAVTVRVLKPLATSVVVTSDAGAVPLTHEHEGIWVGTLPVEKVPDYRLEVTYDGHTLELDDPYRFLPTLGEIDLHLINEGRHEQLWDVLGAHVKHYPGADDTTVDGTAFAVWAPRARAVRVKGDFNSWDGREHPMRRLASSGVWELFVPGVGKDAQYKYAILGVDGVWHEKADPLAFAAEHPPATSSVVHEPNYPWGDDEWLAQRATKAAIHEPMSIYEVHLASWRRGRTYSQLAEELVPYVRDNGFTHVELMPVMQHPFGGSWGYHVTSYFAPDSRLGSPDELRYLIDSFHQAGVGVILDWVPGHFATDPWALKQFDGAPLYEDPNPQRGWHQEWGSYIFDFGRREVRNFLVANACFWLEEFHVDGLRVDGVASMLYLDYARKAGEWTPNVHGGRENLEAESFLQEMNATVYKRYPGVVTIAEESTAWPGVTRPTDQGGLGFGFKWNMGWMHDTLDYLHRDPLYRSYHHHEMTFALTYAWSENYVLPLSHDEVVHGKGSLLRKMPGDRWQQLANLRAYLAFMWAHPGKQLIFMGDEIGQDAEWAESRELDWWLLDHPEHAGLLALVRDLNRVYRESPALWRFDDDPTMFSWIEADDAAHNVYAFVRRSRDGEHLVCVSNFAAVPHSYRLGLPVAGAWEEVVNTDAGGYTGSGVGNLGSVTAVEGAWSGQPAHADLVVPPLATLWLRLAAD